MLDRIYVHQPLGPTREQVKNAIHKVAVSLPQKAAPDDLMPAESDDTDVQAERILHLWQGFLSLLAPSPKHDLAKE